MKKRSRKGVTGPQKEYPVTPEQFVIAWQTSESTQEVAARLKMPISLVYSRASFYRKRGVHLKKMRQRSTKGLSVKELNVLAEKTLAQSQKRPAN